MSRQFSGRWLGRQHYLETHALQERLLAARQRGEIGDTLLFVEHEPVVTLGRGAKSQNVLFSQSELEARGVGLVSTARGGDVTLHAPGQLVAYPIISLEPDRRDVRRYVRDLTHVMQVLIGDYGVVGGTIDRFIGLWVDRERPRIWEGQNQALAPAKMGAIGVRISRWVTMHGFALNLSPDLELFRLIVPCGISEYPVCSLESVSGSKVQPEALARRAFDVFCEKFEATALSFEGY